MKYLETFKFDNSNLSVSFVETMQVKDGVECDVYTFDKDDSKDLGIVRVKPGHKTPLQKVLKGKKTIEGFVSGKGKLTITKPDGLQKTYETIIYNPLIVTVQIGELMQWEADKVIGLTFYEICFPPYKDGRFENLS